MAGGIVIVGEAKVVIHAAIARVYEALLNPTDLAAWWSPEATVEPSVGGRYETRPVAGRQVGAIVFVLAPRRLAFTWPMGGDEPVVLTTVSYELLAHGTDTEVHVVHRSPKLLGPGWQPPWSGALAALKSYLEAETAAAQATGPDGQPSA